MAWEAANAAKSEFDNHNWESAIKLYEQLEERAIEVNDDCGHLAGDGKLRVIESADARTDYNSAREKQATLDYLRHDPVHRKHHHRNLTFGLLYAWLMIHRFRILWLENRLEDNALGTAIAIEQEAALTPVGRLITRGRLVPEFEKVVFALNWFAVGDHAAYWVALEKGYYKAKGLDVRIVYSPTDALKLARLNPDKHVLARENLRRADLLDRSGGRRPCAVPGGRRPTILPASASKRRCSARPRCASSAWAVTHERRRGSRPKRPARCASSGPVMQA